MDEQIIQQSREISRKIVEKEFPDEKEFFDFTFDLVIQELEELEPGKEVEFLREIRVVHPEMVLGFTPIVIILTFHVLTKVIQRKVTEGVIEGESIKDIIEKKAATMLKDEGNRRRLSDISKCFEDIYGVQC